MCSGKTTLGKALSQKTGYRFIDLDEYIENREKMSVSEIFKKYGEKGFRNLEKKALHEVASIDNCIISCGGGTPCFFDNIDFMNIQGSTFFLEASEEKLLSRLMLYGASRPLVAGKTRHQVMETIKTQLPARLTFYKKAKHTFNADFLDSEEEIENSTINFIKEFAI